MGEGAAGGALGAEEALPPDRLVACVLVVRAGARTGGRRVGEARGASACVVRIYDSRERCEGI